VPELPEVEIVRGGLEKFVVGRTILAAEVLHPRAVRRHLPGPDDFAGQLRGATVLAARRRGKYLWLPLQTSPTLASGAALIGHLGMSGQLLVRPADAPDEVHLRVRLTFTDGDPQLRFVDQRTFGGLHVVEWSAGHAGQVVRHGAGIADGPVPAEIAHIAPDPLDSGFDDDAVAAAVRRRRTGIKRALLDQALISGVGNIYADEALWRAKLHYARPTETLTRPEIGRVLAGIREVMDAALAAGGTSFDALYVDVNGESGYFDRTLEVYGREAEPCRRCGTLIRRDPFMNRSSYTCPRCQPRPRRARW
jgi:formamidopyrimidine-DNA glycosylase